MNPTLTALLIAIGCQLVVLVLNAIIFLREAAIERRLSQVEARRSV